MGDVSPVIPDRVAGVLAAALSLGAPASASTPSLMWQDASAIRVHCLVHTETGSGVSDFQRQLCDRVTKLVARWAPVPVSAIGFGDPAILAPGTVALLVHASLQPAVADRSALLIFSIRPMRASAGQSEILFGAAPRAVPAGDQQQIDRALDAALDEILPWRRMPTAPRPIN